MDPTTTALIYSTLALLIGALVRVVKDDSTPLTLKGITVPSAWRPLLALALGAVGGAIDAVARGTPWTQALLMGFGSAIAAMLGHNVVVEGARGGREIGMPKVPPGVGAALLVFGLGGSGVTLDGCKAFTSAEPVVVRSVDEACSVVTMMSTSGLVHAFCVAFDDLVAIERELLAARAEGRNARVRVMGLDGSTVDVEIDARHIEEALQNVSKAKLGAGHK